MATQPQRAFLAAAALGAVGIAACAIGSVVAHRGPDAAPGGRFWTFGGVVCFAAAVALLLLEGLLTKRPMGRRGGVAVVVSVALLTLGLGLVLKAPCNDETDGPDWLGHADWSKGDQYRKLCYNDVFVLYHYRGLSTQTFPYVAHGQEQESDSDHSPAGFIEYPTVTGLVMWGESLAVSPPSATAFTYVNALVMAACALATCLALLGSGVAPRRVLWFAAAPALGLYAYHNWDLATVLPATVGLMLFSKRRWAASGAFLGLATSAKLYPGILLVVLGMELLRRRHAAAPLRRLGPISSLAIAGTVLGAAGTLDYPPHGAVLGLGVLALAAAAALVAPQLRRDEWRFVTGAVVALAVLNLPFALYDAVHPYQVPDGAAPYIADAHGNVWLMTYTFHSLRGATYETPWFALSHFASGSMRDWWFGDAPKLAAPFLVVLVAGVAALVVSGRLDWRLGCVAALGVFLVLNKVASVQYALWMLPLLVLAPMPWWAIGAYLAGDVAVFGTIWRYFLTGGEPYEGMFAWAVLARTAALVLLVVVAVWRGRPSAGQPAHPSAPEAIPPAGHQAG